MLGDNRLADELAADHETADLDARRHAMLDYAARLTRTPDEITRGHVERLREAGFSDEDILAIAEVTAYYAYVNRIVDGLGVEIEPGLRPE